MVGATSAAGVVEGQRCFVRTLLGCASTLASAVATAAPNRPEVAELIAGQARLERSWLVAYAWFQKHRQSSRLKDQFSRLDRLRW
jgi:hypothetical protein